MPKDLPNADFSIKVIQGEPVEIPSADMLIDASFTKDGADLVIQGEGGQTITVEGYFSGLDTPDLVHDSGLRLSSDMIDSFVKSSHAGEYAQGGSLTMNDASAVGQITEIVGDVMITRADGTEIIAEIGTVIQQGDVIETSADGAANILFADNTSFAVSEDARLSVDEFKYDSEAQEGSSFFSMLKGAFVYTSGMIGKDDPGNVNIETPTGSIGIRGTVVMGKIDPAGLNTEITILDGAVVITNAAGTVELDDMFETVRLGGYDSQPENLGQMTSEYIQSNFKSLGGVARETFGRAFGRSQNTGDGENRGNEGEQNVAPDAPQPKGDQHGEMMENPDVINKANGRFQDVEVGRKAPLPPKALEAKPFSEGLPDSSLLVTPPPGEITDTNTEAPPPPPIKFAFRMPTTPYRVHEFEDQGFIVGKVGTFGTEATGVTYTLMNTGTPFIVDSTTGVIRVQNPFDLNASDHTDFLLRIKATNATGESIGHDFKVQLDPLLDLAAARTLGTPADDAGGSLLYAVDNTNDELVFGGQGNDLIIENTTGNSILMGGTGNDTIQIDNTSGMQKVLAGGGNDVIQIRSQDAQDFIDGEAGHDKLVIKHQNASNLNINLDGANVDHYRSIEELYLLNNTSTNPIILKVDSMTVNKLTGLDGILEINGGSSGGTNYVQMVGDWERLTQYDGKLFGNNANSAAFRNVETNELIVTKSANQINFQEEVTAGSFGTVNTNGANAGDPLNIPELSHFL